MANDTITYVSQYTLGGLEVLGMGAIFELGLTRAPQKYGVKSQQQGTAAGYS
jgi:hypothetical protein